jgi:hypothetical protein
MHLHYLDALLHDLKSQVFLKYLYEELRDLNTYFGLHLNVGRELNLGTLFQYQSFVNLKVN